VRGEIKHKQKSYTFENYATLIYSANELPATKDTTDAFFRRWLILEFPYKFTEVPDDEHKDKDPDVLEDLTTEEELAGLFNWGVQGLRRVLDDEKFTKTGRIEEIKEKWLTRTNPLEVFVDNHCVIDRDRYIKKDDFYEQYQIFCELHGVEALAKNVVGRQMPELRPEIRAARPQIMGSRVNVWDNVRLADDSPFNPNNDLSPSDGSTRVRDVRDSRKYNAHAHTRTSVSEENPDIPDENENEEELSEDDREFLEEEWEAADDETGQISFGDLSDVEQSVVKFVERVGPAKPSEFAHVTKPDSPHTIAEDLAEKGVLDREGDRYRRGEER